MKETNEKPKPPLVKAEVIDNMVALNVGESGPDGRRIENVYKPFFKGAIVEVDPITFRNLERDGRLKAAPDSDAGVADMPKKKKKKSVAETVGDQSVGQVTSGRPAAECSQDGNN